MRRGMSRAMTRGSPKRRAGAALPSVVTAGSATRSKAGLARTQPCPARSVSSRRALTSRALACSSSRLRRRRWHRRPPGALTTVSIRSARPSLRYCLMRECLKNTLIVTSVSRVTTLVLQATPSLTGRPRPPGRFPVKISSTLSGAAQAGVVGDQCLEERPGPARRVEDQGAGGLDLAHRQFPPVAGIPVSRSQRQHTHPPPGEHLDGPGTEPGHRSPAGYPGPRRRRTRWQLGEPDPGPHALALAHSCPLTHTFTG